jgi:hypothetical protein
VDGPQSITGIHRQVVPLKCISLTDVVVAKLPRNSTQKNLVKAWTEQSTLATWQKTAWAKKLDSKAKRAAMTDFDRFKLMVAKKQKVNLFLKMEVFADLSVLTTLLLSLCDSFSGEIDCGEDEVNSWLLLCK